MEEGRGEIRHLELLCQKPKRIRNPVGAGGDRARPPSGLFRTLLESTVWVPGTGREQVVEDSALDLLHWEKDDGTSVIPFFTSLEALQEAVEDEQTFVVMPVRTLFEMTRRCSSTPNYRPGKSLLRAKSAI